MGEGKILRKEVKRCKAPEERKNEYEKINRERLILHDIISHMGTLVTEGLCSYTE